jgi:4-hydroxy-2-oxoheptanedioate aldolase
MAVAINLFKKALREGRTQIGFWQALANPISVEISAGAGFDWLLFDGEHGPNDVPTLLSQLQAAAAYPVHPIGRVPIGDTTIIKQYLDIGFQSLLVPIVETAEHAALLARAVRYPPHGIRGVGTGVIRASGYNRNANYVHEADAEICLLVQVETRKGLDNLAAIAATEGVDGVFIGPADLSAALGYRGQPNHPDVRKAIEEAGQIIKSAGKAAGILMADETLARHYLEQGFTFVAVGTDVGLLVKGTGDLVKKYKGEPTDEANAAAKAPSVY